MAGIPIRIASRQMDAVMLLVNSLCTRNRKTLRDINALLLGCRLLARSPPGVVNTTAKECNPNQLMAGQCYKFITPMTLKKS